VALTVAGQWRNFTVFPNILAIAIMGRPIFAGNAADRRMGVAAIQSLAQKQQRAKDGRPNVLPLRKNW
jgi:hypothetical protein